MKAVEREALSQLLMAETWMQKSEVVERYQAQMACLRLVLREEADLAIQRGDISDAHIFAAHVSLIDEIQRQGLSLVQAELLRATERHDYSGSRRRCISTRTGLFSVAQMRS